MIITYAWLKEHFETLDISASQLVNIFNCIGCEVESFYQPNISHDYLIAKIINAEKHPESKKLTICTIDIGNNTQKTVICGGSNVYKGMYAVYSPVGSCVGDTEITIREIMGVKSHGMLLSEDELHCDYHFNFPTKPKGIIDLSDVDVYPGQKFVDTFEINTPIIEIDITPNRGDLMSIYGIARELAGFGYGTMKDYKKNSNIQQANQIKYINNKCANQYIACEINNITSVKLPAEIFIRILIAGHTNKNTLISISNYAMLNIGYPNHLFDRNKVNNIIITRPASKEDAFLPLNSENIISNYSEYDSLIKSDNDIIAIGGIIGGREHSIDNSTSSIVIEVASFEQSDIARSSSFHTICTDSSIRFSRGIDHHRALHFMQYIVKLIEDICHGSINGFYHSIINEPISNTIEIEHVSADVFTGYDKQLIAMGYKILDNNIIAPSWRNDVTSYRVIQSDLIRYQSIRNELSHRPIRNIKIDPRILYKQKIKSLLIGYAKEVMTLSFISDDILKLFDSIDDATEIINPLSREQGFLRTDIAQSLFKYAVNQIAYKNNNINVFEIGDWHFQHKEYFGIGGLQTGNIYRKHWAHDIREYDFFDMKKHVQSILDLFHIKYVFKKSEKEFLYSNSSVEIEVDGVSIGYFGMLHPLVMKKMGIKQHNHDIYIYNLHINTDWCLKNDALKIGIIRDICCKLPENGFSVIENIINNFDGIHAVRVFDIYAENNTVAFSIHFLNDNKSDVDRAMEQIYQSIQGIGYEVYS